jgi:hypothetical protein
MTPLLLGTKGRNRFCHHGHVAPLKVWANRRNHRHTAGRISGGHQRCR